MFPASDRGFSRRDTVLFAGCMVLAVTALFTPERITLGIANGLRETVLAPLVWLQEQAEAGRGSRARLRSLLVERDSAAYAAQGLPALSVENERLRSLLGLSHRIKTPYVAAEVLHQAQVTDARMLLLSVGQVEGVTSFDPIVAPEGLIGVIWNAGRTTSVAMTWAHPEFRVSAFTANGSAYGIVAASPNATGSEAYLEFRGVPYRDSVMPGTVVLSSGLGGVYPKGIPIGTVMGVIREEAGWARVYRVRPAANPASTGHVLVLTGRRLATVAEAFPSDTLEPTPRSDSLKPAAPVRPRPDSVARPKLDSASRARADSIARVRRRAAAADSARRRARADSARLAVPAPAEPAPPARADTTP
ncbi:MAG TPA: rod shape-determining protein MreC [Gemmatimonadales bacterium]|jgi:rod shape-determining protein MreC